jgi:hypothetical protein
MWSFAASPSFGELLDSLVAGPGQKGIPSGAHDHPIVSR